MITQPNYVPTTQLLARPVPLWANLFELTTALLKKFPMCRVSDTKTHCTCILCGQATMGVTLKCKHILIILALALAACGDPDKDQGQIEFVEVDFTAAKFNGSNPLVTYINERLPEGTYGGTMTLNRECMVTVQYSGKKKDNLAVQMYAGPFQNDPSSLLEFNLSNQASPEDTEITESSLRTNVFHTIILGNNEFGEPEVTSYMLSVNLGAKGVESIYINDPDNNGVSLASAECYVKTYGQEVVELP